MADIAQWLQDIMEGKASPQIKDMASRGLVPFPPDQMIRILAVLSDDEDDNIKSNARQTFTELPRPLLINNAQNRETDQSVIRLLSKCFKDDEEILTNLARNPAIPEDTFMWLSGTHFPDVLEAVVRNQEHLRKNQDALERLIENPKLPAQLKGYLSEEIERRKVEKGPVYEEAPPKEEIPEVTFEEVVIKDFDKEDAETPYNIRKEVQEKRRKSIVEVIRGLNAGEKLILAMRGNREARYLLVRDSNKQVATKVLESPRMSDKEIEMIAKMTNVCDDVLRSIAKKKEWMGKYNIVKALVLNAKTPVGISLPLVNKITIKDLSHLAKNRNIPEVIRQTAARLYRLRHEMRS